ncbi:zinc finger protein 570 isoform X1 [Bombyx mori]|uniref:C2H2-type domain-containing protein n=1 Tax=Bombyx mori TaxID=7091 RepID=A0A8R2AHU7_BOMMO|nr:zinc finger protein 570 isoform X1 [Bombyx mori]
METEVKMYFGRCRCCLEYGYLKYLWSEHKWQGHTEVYGEMLTKCYAFSWIQLDSEDYNQICDPCIKRLRESCSFRNLVIRSQKQLMDEISNGHESTIKIEYVNEAEKDSSEPELMRDSVYEEVEFLDDVPVDVKPKENVDRKRMSISPTKRKLPNKQAKNIDNRLTKYVVGDPEKTMDVSRSKKNSRIDTTNHNGNSNRMLTEELDEYSDKQTLVPKIEFLEVESQEIVEEINKDEEIGLEKKTYEEVEYLEEDVTDNSQLEKDPITVCLTRKWPKKLPRAERNKRYLQYTEEDLRNGVEAVRNNRMSRLEAAEFYNVPRKTLAAKLKMDEESVDPAREEMYVFIKEIKKILSFTNATPYKSKMSTYSCAYCTEVYFQTADDLRNHTRTNHIDERTKKVDLMMRPHAMNEILKLDVKNLICVVCCIPMDDWNGLFRHLKNTHGIVFTYAYKRVIPYILDEEPDCVLCKQHFTNYVQLDVHMNSHYDNYVCDDCGQTFISAARLKNHSKKHDVGKHTCKYCNKVFGLEHYLKKHEAVVHKARLYYKCYHCPEKLPSDRERKEHIEANHREKVKEISCDMCGKIFNWRQYYIAHLRKVHGDRKYECTVCDKKFSQNGDLSRHVESRHNGAKNHVCPMCERRYSSKAALVTHFKIHSNNNEVVVINYT